MDYARRQQEKFLRFGEVAKSVRADIKLHSQNSAGTVMHREFGAGMDYVRAGIAMYGCCPAGHGRVAAFANSATPVTAECEICGAWNGTWSGAAGRCGLRQVMTVRTRLAEIRDAAPGSYVSYGRTYTTSGSSEKLGVITAGYADGFTRRLSGRGYRVMLGENSDAKPAEVRGRITMDQSVIHAADDSRVGDVVTLFCGDYPDTHFDTAAALTDTISYEIMCGISPRAVRVAT